MLVTVLLVREGSEESVTRDLVSIEAKPSHVDNTPMAKQKETRSSSNSPALITPKTTKNRPGPVCSYVLSNYGRGGFENRAEPIFVHRVSA